MSVPSEQFQLADEPLEPLFLLLEASGGDVDVRLETPHGRAILKIRGGQLQSAELGEASGLSAAHNALSTSVGTYELEYDPKNSEVSRHLNTSLTSLLAEDNRYSEHGVEPSVRSILERTSSPLPGGLIASELRLLSEIDGTLPLVLLTKRLKERPHEVLRAARSLLKRQLIRLTTSRTLHLGTPIPEPPHATNEGSDDRSRSPTAILRSVKRPVPAQWARGARQLSGRYSSAPPAALAEEQVHLPHFVAAQPASRKQADQDWDKDFIHDAPRTPPKTLPSTPPPAVLNELDDPLHDEDFEAPFPLITGNEVWPYRKPMQTLDDEVVRAVARGQLTDSEMPVPSSHLSRATLEQLGQLDQAIASSRGSAIPRSEPENFDIESPGSVPGSQALPQGAHFNPETGLPTVGRYEVLARLKSGGMGSVYMCRLSGAAGFRRLFAMKVLHGHLADEQDTLDSFFHEARVLAGLHHPNVVGIVDVGTPQEPFIVLDYVEGGSLLELFRTSTPEDGLKPIVTIILDALAGLHAAHTATDEDGHLLSVVHCDVTPHNLLVGVDGTCRVTDFGIARTGNEPIRSEVTRGKPGYIAPERIRRQPSDHRSDIFSLGVVLYAGLTGEEPFYADSAEETMQNVLRKAVLPPSEVGCRPPPCLDWVCAKALARNPDERFQTADEMAHQLRRIAEREGLLATRSEVAAWVRKSLSPTLAARRAASQRGTIPPSDRGPQSVSARPRLPSRPAQNSRLPQLDAAPAVEGSRAEHTGPLSDLPHSGRDADNTEILDSLKPGPMRLVKKALLYATLLAAMAALVYVVLFPDAVGSLLRDGSTSPPAPPAGNTEESLDAANPEKANAADPTQQGSSPDVVDSTNPAPSTEEQREAAPLAVPALSTE